MLAGRTARRSSRSSTWVRDQLAVAARTARRRNTCRSMPPGWRRPDGHDDTAGVGVVAGHRRARRRHRAPGPRFYHHHHLPATCLPPACHLPATTPTHATTHLPPPPPPPACHHHHHLGGGHPPRQADPQARDGSGGWAGGGAPHSTWLRRCPPARCSWTRRWWGADPAMTGLERAEPGPAALLRERDLAGGPAPRAGARTCRAEGQDAIAADRGDHDRLRPAWTKRRALLSEPLTGRVPGGPIKTGVWRGVPPS